LSALLRVWMSVTKGLIAPQTCFTYEPALTPEDDEDDEDDEDEPQPAIAITAARAARAAKTAGMFFRLVMRSRKPYRPDRIDADRRE
jgi:hypothetical protein